MATSRTSSSSSTTRMVSTGVTSADCSRIAGLVTADATLGSRIVTVVPHPLFRMELHHSRGLTHDPVHRGETQPSALVLGLGAEEWLKGPIDGLLVHSSAGIRNTEANVRAGLDQRVERRVFVIDGEVVRVDPRVPPIGMASRALTARFRRICSICPRSARTLLRSLGPCVISFTCSPIVRRSNVSTSLTVLLMSRTSGFSRLSGQRRAIAG